MKVLNWLDEHLEEAILCVLLAAMTIIMGIQVFSRYCLGSSLSWSEEITRYLFIWSAFLSVSYCTKKRINIRVEQFVSIIPEKVYSYIKVVDDIIRLLIFIYLIPFAYTYFIKAVESGQLSPACGIPMYLIQIAPLTGFILVIIRVAQQLWLEIKEFGNRKPKEEN